jgi:hypothetical protein
MIQRYPHEEDILLVYEEMLVLIKIEAIGRDLLTDAMWIHKQHLRNTLDSFRAKYML